MATRCYSRGAFETQAQVSPPTLACLARSAQVGTHSAILSKLGNGGHAHHVVHGRKPLQMHGFHVQVYGNTLGAITLILRH